MYHVACIMYTIARGLQGAKCECKVRPVAVVVRRTTYFHASSTHHTPPRNSPPTHLQLHLLLLACHSHSHSLPHAALLLRSFATTPTPSSIPHHDATATAAYLPRPPASTPHVLSVPPPPVQPRAAACPQSLYSFNAPPSLFRSRPFGSAIPRASRAWLISSFLHPSIPTLKDGRTEGTPL